MAQLHPSLPPRRAFTAGAHAELGVLHRLEDGLPAAYTLFHSVDWTDVDDGRVRHGEVDIVVVNQAGDVLQLEVKSGKVHSADDGLFKTYAGQRKDVSHQLVRQHQAIRQGLQAAGLDVTVVQLLVLPDQRIVSPTVRWPRARIVDSDEFEHLPRRVAEALGPGHPDEKRRAAVLDYFANVFQVQPDVSALAGRLLEASARLSSGLATWVPRLRVSSGIVRVSGTAGSGKTQLALRMLREASALGERCAYLCFNRALADHMARVAPVRAEVETFHQMADRMLRAEGAVPDYSAPGVFDAIAAHVADRLGSRPGDLDLLVIDETQDLKPAWVQALLQRLRPAGRALLLEDPQQHLYADREPFEIENEVVVTSPENFRSPRVLVDLCNLLKLTAQPVQAMGPHGGEVSEPIIYGDGIGLSAATVRGVRRCLDRGFTLDDVVVLTLRGRASSELLAADSLGPWALRRFTGDYDSDGNPVWTDGPLLADSVFRFKGQAAQAVVLTECDFETLDDAVKRRLFVGFTRARMHLEWVVSQRSADLIANRLQQ